MRRVADTVTAPINAATEQAVAEQTDPREAIERLVVLLDEPEAWTVASSRPPRGRAPPRTARARLAARTGNARAEIDSLVVVADALAREWPSRRGDTHVADDRAAPARKGCWRRARVLA